MSGSGSAVIKAETQSERVEVAPEWSPLARFAFRFVFCYFVLCMYPSLLGWRDGDQYDQNNLVRKMWDHVVPWVGSHLLHLAGPFAPIPRGGGDQLYDYILWPCIFVVAVMAAAVWSLLDRDRKGYRTLHEWLRVAVRLTLAFVMINYGMGKLFRAQFPEVSLAELVDTYGHSDPMALLWVFMGYSRGYSFFGGLGEILGGALLLVPRFTPLGTLITLAMVSNVWMLNIFYDVPRKIMCVQLFAMCLFLLWPDLRRLFGFFLLHRTEQLSDPAPLFKKKSFNTIALAVQLIIGLAIIVDYARTSYVFSIERAAQIEPVMRGIWNIDEFNFDGSTRSPLLTDPVRWQRVILDRPDLFTIQLMDGTQQEFMVKWNAEKTKGSLWDVNDRSWKGTVTVDSIQGDRMALGGQFGGHVLKAQLRRADLSDPVNFLLINRKFRWIR